MNSAPISVARDKYDAAVYELIAAHRILQAVLAVTTTAQKAKLLKRVESLGVAGEGLVRHNERLLALNGLGVILAHVARASSKTTTPTKLKRLHRTIDKATFPSDAVIIYGPQGCGKTRRTEELLTYFGKSRVVDDWEPSQPIPDNALVLTNYPVAGALNFEAVKTAITQVASK